MIDLILRFFERLTGTQEQNTQLKTILDKIKKIEAIEIQKLRDSATDLNRNQLGAISLDDVRNISKEMTPDERKSYASNVAVIWEQFLEKDLKRFIIAQEEFTTGQAQTWEQVLIGRGGINAFALLYEHYKQLHSEHLDNIKPIDPFDKHKLFPEIEKVG